MSALTAMIGIVIVGMMLFAMAALMLGILDSAQSGAWRRIAAERRATWERRQHIRRRPSHVEAWADQDDI